MPSSFSVYFSTSLLFLKLGQRSSKFNKKERKPNMVILVPIHAKEISGVAIQLHAMAQN
uniref:Brefeldin A-inhibited guanine nucleotide-exchange protein 5 n=1 Tax=Rhizophora mucronata TaxID=61149 RepID=A0A2P2KPF6_RHIMU